jgi:flagellar biosynthesis protein FlhF
MSTQTQPPVSADGDNRQQNGVRTYRGRRLEDLIPKIRAELGPDAIILREREGLMGGINGFFAQRFIEVEARAGARQVDIYDDDELVAPAAAPTAEPAFAPPEESFAAQLEAAAATPPEEDIDPEPEPDPAPQLLDQPELQPIAPEPEPQPEPVAIEAPEPATPAPAAPTKTRRTRVRRAPKPAQPPAPGAQIDAGAAGAVARELVSRGVSEGWTHQLISEAAAHWSPFAEEGGLPEAVRIAIAASISRPGPLPIGGAAIAFVGAGGAGKTRCSASLAAAYRRASTLQVEILSMSGTAGRRQLTDLLKGHDVSVNGVSDRRALVRRLLKTRGSSLVVIDTEAVAPSDVSAVGALAADLETLALDAIYIALPATIGAESGRRLLAGLAPLQPTGIVITHADETDQLGVAVELACASGMPIAFVHDGLDLQRALSAPNPAWIARRLLP